MSSGAWMRQNLATQGSCLSEAERRELRLGLRFSTGLCLALVVTGLALESAALGGPSLPPNPPRRRHAFKLATTWLAAVGILLTAGATTAALALGGLLVAACAAVTATNLCLPSETLALWERLTSREKALTT